MVKIESKKHPRLFINESKIEELKKNAKNDPLLAQMIDNLRKQAENICDRSCVEFKITGPRMLSNCQEIHYRVRTLGLVYLLKKEEKFAIRAKDELINAAAYPHWNKDHFLDTAELITAFAIAYDWLYHALDVEDLKKIKDAMINKGLLLGLEEHKSDIWWAAHKYNWNQVCNGGLIIGALALGDEEPKLCEDVIAATEKHLPVAFNSFGQDGGWEAGPEYWQYTAWFSALMLDVLTNVHGSDFGLSDTKGFSETGLFPIYSAGPLNKYFNFADADEDYTSLPTLFWLGRRFQLNACINENHRLLKIDIEEDRAIDPFNLVWYQPEREAVNLPVSRLFSGINAGYMRSEWDKQDASFIAFKGGDNQADHGHLDQGSFVLDMKGIRWISDLGRDNYDLPGYFDPSEGGGRWKYFRLNNKSHSTLVLNNDLQRASAKSKITGIDHEGSNIYASIDLSEAYAPHARTVNRRIDMMNDDLVQVTDEITWSALNNTARWQVLTDARLEVKGNIAIMHKDKKSLIAKILSPADSIFKIAPANGESHEARNHGFNLLYIDVEADTEFTEIKVSFE